MTHCHYTYATVKRLALQAASKQDLHHLKEIFSKEIGSQRKADRITTVEELIDCLERCDAINEENVELLRMLDNRNMLLLEAIDDYTSGEIIPYNSYREERLAEDQLQQLRSSIRLTQPGQAAQRQQHYTAPAEFTPEKRVAVFRKISKELGRSWRALGRKLSIAEGIMDGIETRFPQDLQSRILNLLQVFEEDPCNDPRHVLMKLCDGLSECGRKDLRRGVEQIMSY